MPAPGENGQVIFRACLKIESGEKELSHHVTINLPGHVKEDNLAISRFFRFGRWSTGFLQYDSTNRSSLPSQKRS